MGGDLRVIAFLAFLGAAFVIIALARPQFLEFERQTKSKGYDIILALDLSSSMLYEDYKDGLKRINRLQAVKPVLNAFIENREHDRIGLVAFSGRAYTVAPLTFDHKWLARQTDRLRPGLIEDGTAIGDGLAVAVARLLEGSKERDGEREGAFAILLTDGENTAGVMQPLAAAEIARDEKIRVFTVGAGRNGLVTQPVFNEQNERIGSRRVPSRMDERTLKEIARITNGEYFRADNSNTIKKAFEKIDETSKVEFESTQFSVTTELFPYFAMSAGIILFIATGLSAATRKEGLS